MTTDCCLHKLTWMAVLLALLGAATPAWAGDVSLAGGHGGRKAGGNDGVGGIEWKPSGPAIPGGNGMQPGPATGFGGAVPPPGGPSLATAGSWTDLGHGLPGRAGSLRLEVVPAPAPESTGTLCVRGGQPGVPGWLIIGWSASCTPFRGGTLVPSPDVVLPGLLLDAGGSLDLDLPAEFPLGPAALVIQAWFVDHGAPRGLAATNGLASPTT